MVTKIGVKRKKCTPNGALCVAVAKERGRVAGRAINERQPLTTSKKASPSPSNATSHNTINKSDTVDRLKHSIEATLEIAVEGNELKAQLLEDLLRKYKTGAATPQGNSTPSHRSSQKLVFAPVTPVASINEKDAFQLTQFGERRKNNNAISKARSEAAAKVNKVIQSIGAITEQVVTLKKVLTKKTNAELGALLKQAMLMDPTSPEAVAVHILQSLRGILKEARKHKTNDSETFQRTIFMAIAPLLEVNTGKVKYSQSLSSMGRHLGVPLSSFKRRMKEAAVSRNAFIMNGSTKNNKLVQTFRRNCRTRFNRAYIKELHHWILNESDEVIASPNAKDCIYVLNPESGLKEQVRKYFYRNSIRDLHNELIAKFKNAKNAEGEVIISDTTLRNLLPAQLSRLADSQKSMCGCELCIIAKSQTTTLNTWRTTYMSVLNAQVSRLPDGNAKRKITATRDKFEAEAFPNNTALWKNHHEAVEAMTCKKVGDTGLFPMKCALGKCNNCPALKIPQSERGEQWCHRQISFHTYQYHSRCRVHGHIGTPTKCPKCAVDPNINKEKLPSVSRKKQLVLVRVPIGVFHRKYYIPTMTEYRYHITHVALLGKHHCVGMRREAYQHVEGAALCQRDYADRLLADFNNEIQSTHFGENMSVSMEGATFRFMEREQESMNYYSFISDGKRQDARTTYLNTLQQISHAREHRKLLPEGSTLYEIMDGCGKQYRSANALFLMSATASQVRINVNRMIQAPHHGKGDCDSQNGVDKNYIRQHMRVILTPEVEKESNFIEAHTVQDGNIIKFSDRVVKLLDDPRRASGVKGNRKHNKREQAAKISQRVYFSMHHEDAEKESSLPILDVTYEVKSGFEKIEEDDVKTGLMGHYHLLADYNLPVGTVAVRRIPCACDQCNQMLALKWVHGVPPEDQPRYQDVNNCLLKDVLQGYNGWKIVRVAPKTKKGEPLKHPEQVEAIYASVLDAHDTRAMANINIDSFGAYQNDDDDTEGYYIIRFTSEPFTLQAPMNVQGVDDGPMPAGSIVVKGMYWNPIPGAKKWYNPPTTTAGRETLFRVRYVISTDVIMHSIGQSGAALPNGLAKQLKERATVLGAKKVDATSHDEILAEIAQRSLFDYYESGGNTSDGDSNNTVDDDDNDDNRSDSQDDQPDSEEDSDEEDEIIPPPKIRRFNG